uniref:Uncharacterized protein n=1 Tax=viral metagenome TaxID=1070528 RepID=A0A6C0K874_9ZZZZ
MATVDLNNSFKYDKVVINLNSSNCLVNDPSATNYYINLVEPLRNVIYVKMLKASVLTNNTIVPLLSYNKYDPIYISVNDYDRSVSYIKSTQVLNSNYVLNSVPKVLSTSNVVFDTAKYFDIIPYSKETFSEISYSQASFDWTDPSVYILNPPEPNLRRLNIEIRDKSFNLFDTSVLTDFNLSICAYLIKNRV